MTAKITDEQILEIIRTTLSKMIENEQKETAAVNNGIIRKCGGTLPVEASGRHIHLSQTDLEKLFGKGYQLTKKKDISQPGQYLCEERVTLVGPRGEISNVAVLGPVRKETQVELSVTDCRLLGIKPVVRMSGDLEGAEDILVVNGDKKLEAKSAAIVAKNHVHMTPEDAKAYGVVNGQLINIRVGTERPVVFENVPVRVSETAKLAFHIDFDEANACGYSDGMTGAVIGYRGLYKKGDKACEQACDKMKEAAVCFEKIVTETDVIQLFKDNANVIYVKKNTIITPLAKDTISEKNIEVKIVD